MPLWLLAADEASLEQEAERKIGWLLKLFFAGTASFVAYQFFPYMGTLLFFETNLMLLEISLHVVSGIFGYAIWLFALILLCD